MHEASTFPSARTARRWAGALLLLWPVAAPLATPGAAPAQVDLSTLDRGLAGPRTQVLVLGTVHLSGMPKGFKPDSLAPVLDRLAAYRPDVITIEAISGEGCDLMQRHPAVYGPAADNPSCGDPAAARAATGLDVPAAIAEVQRTLKDWPATPEPARRRRLAAAFLAADEGASALVQWLQLPGQERHAGDGLDAALVTRLDELAARNNENYLVAARLAARLGLQRLHAIDDHTGDSLDLAKSEEEAFGQAIRRAWEEGGAQARPMRQRQEELSRGGDMLALYRFVNRPDVLRLAVEADFGAALRDRSPQRYGQRYVAGWETRNLRMVANVRAAFRERPGARVLSIVGASHKPWFDGLLGQLQGVELVDAEQVLK